MVIIAVIDVDTLSMAWKITSSYKIMLLLTYLNKTDDFQVSLVKFR